MITKCLVTFVIAFSFMTGFAHLDCSAAMYKYVDGEGKEYYTDSHQSIPEEYRKSAVQIDKQLEKAPLTIADIPERAEKVPHSTNTFERIQHWLGGYVGSVSFKIGIFAISFAFVFVALYRLRDTIGHRRVGYMYLLLISCLLFVFIYQSYVKAVLNSYLELREKVEAVKEQAEKRNEEINRMVNDVFRETAKQKTSNRQQ